MFQSPLQYALEIATLLVRVKVWPWVVNAVHPVRGHQSDICIAHDELSEHLQAMIYQYVRILGLANSFGERTYMCFDHGLWGVAEVKRLGLVIFEVEV